MKKTNLFKSVVTGLLTVACAGNALAQNSSSVCENAYFTALHNMEQEDLPQAQEIINRRSNVVEPLYGLVGGMTGAAAGLGIAKLIDSNHVKAAVLIGAAVGLASGGMAGEAHHIDGEDAALEVLRTYDRIKEVRVLLHAVNTVNNTPAQYTSIIERYIQRIKAFTRRYINTDVLENVGRDEYHASRFDCRFINDPISKDQCIVDYQKQIDQIVKTVTRLDSTGEICPTNGEVASLDEVVNLIKVDLNK